ncbi:phospholipase A2 inhibitor and Ly6/PLAUR domain-containing protein-like [Solea solea]|uniref:phospholipase A2 inhibitor and Ly6/PLAUR domain-containing protein-like n=1 Tax=Solea solea TaxID=90069 RepID=UPI00272B6F75|nr:phospholipase A2 inhibitor and Ly6/PLAUR domain-containing protein-like [Solea solea]
MKLLLTVCLTWTLFYTARSLSCHVCSDRQCSNTTTVQCPDSSTMCTTVTSVISNGLSVSLEINKNCSSLTSCTTPLSTVVELSVNLGYSRYSYTQICCDTDNCNFQTLAIPSVFPNGKVCPACASANHSLAGTCNTTMKCMGAENSCFTSNSTSDSSKKVELGCMTKNLCTIQAAISSLFADNPKVTCGAPWSVRIGAVLPALALTVYKVLV